MPAVLTRRCPHCGHLNSYDLAELRRQERIVYRGEEQEEFQVSCANPICAQKRFVIIVRERDEA